MAKGQGRMVLQATKSKAVPFGVPFGGGPFGQKKTGGPKPSRSTKHEA
jgi:hypothetical protein